MVLQKGNLSFERRSSPNLEKYRHVHKREAIIGSLLTLKAFKSCRKMSCAIFERFKSLICSPCAQVHSL